MIRKQVVLLGCPALGGPLRAAGAVVLPNGEAPPETTVGHDLAVVVAKPAQARAAWAQAQAASGASVVLLAGPDDNVSPPPSVFVLRLPASVDDLLGALGSDGVGGVIGTAEIGVDLKVRPTRARDGLGLSRSQGTHGPTPVPSQGTSPERRGTVPLMGSGTGAGAASPIAEGFPSPAAGFSPGPRRPAAGQQAPIPPRTAFGEREATSEGPTVAAQRPRPASFAPPRKMGALLICFAGKGGVGKSTMTLALAEQASSLGLRAVVADANRGQGDLRKYLRVNQAYLPSVVDAATSGDPTRAIVTPERLAAARPAGLPVPSFSTVLAPTDTQADPKLVTPQVYREVVGAVREIADIVVVDTQIVEASDIGGMVDNFMVPELLAGAWGLGISDPSVGADNLLRRLYMFAARHVGPERLMVALNRVEPTSGLNQEAMIRLVEPYATWMGAVKATSSIVTAFESGAIPTSPEMEELLGRVLAKVTGVVPAPVKKEEPKRQKRRLFRWRG